jgi:signal transduction histidine kinase/CheY-like chemotaxis protein
MNLRQFWKDRKVATKLYFVVGIMGMLIAIELMTLRFAMTQLSAVRAFVGGEGLWSKAQKTATIALQHYSLTGDEADFKAYVKAVDVPLGDHQARIELIKQNPNYQTLTQGFLRGRIHADDIPGVINLVRRFYWAPYLSEALGIWANGDSVMDTLIKESDELHQLVQSKAANNLIREKIHQIEGLNDTFTKIEDDFSFTLGEGSRWLEGVVMTSLLLLVLTVESTGLFLTFTFSRSLSKNLLELSETARRVGEGDFSKRLTVHSRDELGQLADSLNQMTERLEQSIGERKHAEQANETKSAFLANMSHEIRTPLNAILGFATVLKDNRIEQDERIQYLEIIERNGKALTKVIDDILDLSKVEAGGLVIENLEFSLTSILQDLLALFKPSASDKGIELQLVISPEARKAVGSDPTRVRQVLTNLIGNAIKFTEKGSVRIEATTAVGPNGHELFRISVHDTGIGLSLSQTNKLFEPFAQADSSMTRKFGGTGLGLVLSRRLARALGGDVYIKNTSLNRGSTFVAEFENRQGQLKSRTMAQIHSNLRGQVSEIRLLVVDDSEDNRRLIDVLLSRHGITADFAEDGAKAIELANQNQYDLILMDIQMPNMDGYQAIAKLRELSFLKPIVALTAHAMKDERDRCIRAGFNDHLAKPVDEMMLISTLSRYAT